MVYHFHNWVADSGSRSLDVEHRAYGRSGVHHISEAVCLAWLDVPSHEHEWNMGVGMCPCAVLRAIVSLIEVVVEESGAQNGNHVATTGCIIAVYDALSDPLRHSSRGSLLVVYHIREILVLLLQFANDGVLHLLAADVVLCEEVVVDIEVVADIVLYVFALNAKLLRESLVEAVDDRTHVGASAWQLVLLHGVGVVSATVVGSEEEQIVALAHLLVECVEEML